MHIKWDNQSAKPLKHGEATEIDLILWIAKTFWQKSYQAQREFNGCMYFRKSDAKYVTTIHQSSFSVEKLQAQIHSKPPPDDNDGHGYDYTAYWHTHFDIIIYKTDGERLASLKNKMNAAYANNVWAGADVDNMLKQHPLWTKFHPNDNPHMKRFPGVTGYIISPTQILPYKPWVPDSQQPRPFPWH